MERSVGLPEKEAREWESGDKLLFNWMGRKGLTGVKIGVVVVWLKSQCSMGRCDVNQLRGWETGTLTTNTHITPYHKPYKQHTDTHYTYALYVHTLIHPVCMHSTDQVRATHTEQRKHHKHTYLTHTPHTIHTNLPLSPLWGTWLFLEGPEGCKSTIVLSSREPLFLLEISWKIPKRFGGDVERKSWDLALINWGWELL